MAEAERFRQNSSRCRSWGLMENFQALGRWTVPGSGQKRLKSSRYSGQRRARMTLNALSRKM